MRTSVSNEDAPAASNPLKPVLELLLLEDSFLPLVMNWAADEDWSDLLLFLLETDTLRFPSLLAQTTNAYKSKFLSDRCTLSRIVKSYISVTKADQKGLRVGSLLSSEKLASVEKLSSYGIPLVAAFSTICDRTWLKVMELGDNLPSKKCIWSALQKSITDDTKLELITVLKKDDYRSFFINFLQQSPAEYACLQCCLQVRFILDALEKFKYSSSGDDEQCEVVENQDHTNSVIECSRHLLERRGSQHIHRTPSDIGKTVVVATTAKRKGSFFAVRRPSMTTPGNAQGSSSVATRGGADILAPFATPGVPIVGTVSAAFQGERGVDYSDPLGAFALLLLETRKLHKKFFSAPVSGPPSVTMASAQGVRGSMDFSHSTYSSVPSGSSVVSSYKGSMDSPSTAPTALSNLPCAGPSETLRLELTATLAQTSSVYPADVEALETVFAMTFANRLEKILQELERETFQHLQLRFPHFLASPEYVFLVAQEKAEESKKVRSYRSFQTFIDFVKNNNESPFLSGFSLDEVSYFDFNAHEEDLEESLKGKLFIHHGDEFSLHLNKFGSFYCRDSQSDEETERTLDQDSTLRPLIIPEHGHNTVSDSEEGHRPEGEALCDLYPSLSPKALSTPPPLLSTTLPLPPPPLVIPSNGINTSTNNNSNNNGSNIGVLLGKDNEPVNRRRASVRINKAWNLGSAQATELSEPETFNPTVEPGIDIMNPSDDEEASKSASHVPYMLASLSSRFTLQLSMLLCSNMSVVLVSLSPDLIEAAVGALPLLMSPLSLPVSHDSETLHGKEEINIWWDKFLTRYHLALITKQNQAESRSMRRAGGGAGAGGGGGGRGVARSSSSKTMRVTSASCRSWLVGMNSIDFYNSQMLKDLSYHDCKCAEALCVFDLDTLTLISPQRDNIDPRSGSGPACPTHWKKALLSTKTFQCYNTPNFKKLHITVNSLLKKLQPRQCEKKVEKQIYCTPSKEKENIFDSNRGRNKLQSSAGEREPSQKGKNLFGRILEMSVGDVEARDKKAAAVAVMKQVSDDIQKAFHHYFTAIFYRALPASMLYYPSQKVVACDLNLLHYNLAKHKEPIPLISVAVPPENPMTDSSTSTVPALVPTTAAPPSSSSSEGGFTLTEMLKHPSTMDLEGDTVHAAAAAGESKAGSAFGRGQMQRLFSLKECNDSKELGSKSSERVHNTVIIDADVTVAADKGALPFQGTVDLESAFSHLLVSSPAFFDLVKRHGPVLQHFRF